MISIKEEKFVKSLNIKILILSVFLSVSYFSFFYTKANQELDISLKNNRINIKRPAEKGRLIKVNSVLWSQLFKSNYYYLLEANVIRGDCDIKSINIHSNKNVLEDYQKNIRPVFYDIKFKKEKKKGLLKFCLKHQIYLPKVEIICLPKNSGEISLVIDLELKKVGIRKNISLIMLQVSALILIIFIFLRLFAGIFFSYYSRFTDNSTRKIFNGFSSFDLKLVLKIFLVLLFIFNLTFLFTYLDFFMGIISKEIRNLLVVNFSLFMFITIIFVLLEAKKNRVALVILFSIVLIINFKFNSEVTGDTILWGKNYIKNLLWNSEILSQLINYLFYDFIKFKDFNGIFLITSKIIAIPSLVSLFFLSKKVVCHKDKLNLFFVVTLTGTYLIFFLGYPEYAYWAIPMQLISLFFLIKYLDCTKQKYLIWLAIGLGLGFCLHGSMILLFPAVFIFLVIKNKEEQNSLKKSNEMSKIKRLFRFKYLSLAILIPVCLQIIAMILGYRIVYETSFLESWVTFSPNSGFVTSQLIFFEPDHLKLVGFIFFLSMPSFIILFPYLIVKKRLYMDHITKIILIFSLFQSILILFWNFDYYIRDFDLYLSNTVFCSLFVFKLIIDNLISEQSRLLRKLLIIFLLSITSGIGLMVIFSVRKFLILGQIVG